MGGNQEKNVKNIDSGISCGARKLSRILWLKNTKKETQLKKYYKKANQDTPVIEKKKCN